MAVGAANRAAVQGVEPARGLAGSAARRRTDARTVAIGDEPFGTDARAVGSRTGVVAGEVITCQVFVATRNCSERVGSENSFATAWRTSEDRVL
jgi:hypothetical protein